MDKSTQQEFDVWLKSVTDSSAALEQLLTVATPNATNLADLIGDLSVANDQLELLRPNVENRTYAYDFSTAIQPLAKAKLLLGKARRRLAAATKPEPNAVPPITPQLLNKKVPEIKITPFDGDITKFENFITAFEMKFDSIHIPKKEKLLQLRDVVIEGPLKMIESLSITDENYDRAIADLKAQYSDKDEIIAALYRKLDAVQPATNNPQSLCNTYYEIQGILTALEANRQDLESFPPLKDAVYSRYPVNLIQTICVDQRLPVKELQDRILKTAQFRLKLDASKSKSNPPRINHGVSASLTATKNEKNSNSKQYAKSTQQPSNQQQKKIPPCIFCGQTHYSASCPSVATLEARLVKVNDRCQRCLRPSNPNHTTTTCNKTVTCYYCKAVNQHHSALCTQQFGSTTDAKNNTDPKEKKPIPPEPAKTTLFSRAHHGAHITAQVTIQNPATKKLYQLRALLDNGSNESYIAEMAARRIGLPLSNHRNVPVNVFLREKPISLATATTAFVLTNCNGFHIPIVADTSPAIPQQVQLFDYETFKSSYPQHANKQFINQASDKAIELLIGSDYYYDIIGEKLTVDEGIYLHASQFGWMIVGRQPNDHRQRATYFQLSPTEAINQLCKLDALGIDELPLTRIEEEENALAQFYENLRFEDGRYIIRWPWKKFPPDLDNNLGLAVGRLKSLQKKLTEEQFRECDEILRTQIANGTIDEVPEAEMQDIKHFLPHHVIVKPEKSTASRIVYEGNAKTKNAKSLNDHIYKGRNLLADAGKIIIRFRLKLIVVVSDLEKAFHALGIYRADTFYVCFLWLRNFHLPPTGRNLRILRFLRVLFGITASPFLLHAVIRYHLMKFLKRYKRFVEQLLGDSFVDNFITGFLTLLDAAAYVKFAIDVFRQCSMNLRKWASNSAELRSTFDQPDKYADISILGISWNQYEDTVKIKSIQTTNDPTLRSVLSTVAQFYDPCGVWAPIQVAAKIFIRELHADYQWDDPLTENHRLRWLEIQQQLQLATDRKLTRLQCSLESAQYSLHVFTDASIKACACAVYLRKEEQGNSESHLIFAKTKLSTLTNIPKLELIAVLLGIKALEYVTDAVQITCKRYLWCDAKYVLSWLDSNKILPTFIQRRVDQIRNVQNIERRYVTSAANAADLPSRGASFNQITDDWFHGPPWLAKTENNWPPPLFNIQCDDPTPEEIPKTVAVITTAKYPFDLDTNQYSNYMKLIRITCYLVRFVSGFAVMKARQFFPNRGSNFEAQLLWIAAEQINHFAEIRNAIKNRKKHDLVRKLNIYLDDKNLLRCAGRFKHAPLTKNERCPILLPSPKDSRFVRLLIEHYHTSLFHAGTAAVLAAIRRRFWIPAGRRAVQNIIRACNKCKRYTARPYTQPQDSQVPPFRLEDHATPFENMGIDTFGPIWSSDEKRYVLLATDLVIRAVDMEMLEDMSANIAFLALKTIIARHSPPKIIISDNAPQFKVIETALQNEYTHQWSWKYIPVHSPWEGGVYERMVGISKSALLKTFHNRGVTDPVLRSTLAEISQTINDRPLTYVSSDQNDFEPLTPNHFLRKYYSREIFTEIHMPESATITERQLITLARCCNANLEQFWSIWRSHYLQFLREKGFHRNQAFSKKTTIVIPAPNSVVLIAEKNIKRKNWKLGLITETIPSSDGVIRAAKVKTEHGVLIRPLTELYPLEITDNSRVSVAGTNGENKAENPPSQGLSVNTTESDSDVEEIEIELDFDAE